ncbi:MAG: ABC transporter substrate-binding protein [Deferribacterota bacterium]|nr:ABC transporter substrate-binding protein [Deferribacterota bacterium]
MKYLIRTFFLFLIFLTLSFNVFAKDKTIDFVYVSWTGVTVKTEIANYILNKLGYSTSKKLLSVPFCYVALKSKKADVFLGNWMPVQKHIYNGYKNDVVKLTTNMDGAIYTLAVPKYVYSAGVKHFKDLNRFKDKFEGKIYGLEEGNFGNEVVRYMIKNNLFSLKDWKLVVSSEPAMLAEVRRKISKNKWIVFLGWRPHQMNVMFDIAYLDGSTDETFGANNGASIVNTLVRKGFTKDFPNVTLFLKNLVFPINMMEEIMYKLYKNPNLTPLKASFDYLSKHREVLKKWLEGVETADGKGNAYKLITSDIFK